MSATATTLDYAGHPPDSSPGASPLLELGDVTKTYPGAPAVEALCGVSLAVDGGEMLAVVGPSGSGKSTLLSIMGTLERPTTGVVRVAGHDTSRLADGQLSGLRASLVGFVLQSFHLLDGLTALDNVADGLLYTGRPLAQRRELAHHGLDKVGLAHRCGHHPKAMSGGERQRVAIARAVVGRPAIVLADEPTGNLDSRAGGHVIDILHQLNAEGTTIVVITHDHEVADTMPRRIEIRDGRIVADNGARL